MSARRFFPHQFVDEFHMADHVEVRPQGPVFDFQGVQAVRTGGDNPVEAVPVQCSHVLPGHHLVEVFIARPPGHVAGAVLFLAQYGEIHAGAQENPGHGPGHLHVALDQGAGAAHPEKDVKLLPVRGQGDIKSPGPLGSGDIAAAPGMASLLGADQRRLENFRAFCPRPSNDGVLRSMILSMESAMTGHFCWQAPQVVQKPDFITDRPFGQRFAEVLELHDLLVDNPGRKGLSRCCGPGI